MSRILWALGILALAIPVVAIAAEQSEMDVPKGPVIDFCPTVKQSEAHLEQFGFDYKPDPPNGGVCSRDGLVMPPEDPIKEPAEQSPEELCREEKREYVASKPLPDEDRDPLTFDGETPDGNIVSVMIDGDPAAFKGIDDINEFGRSYEC